MERFILNGTWDLKGRPQLSPEEDMIAIKAEVPGCAQLALSDAGYLPDDLYMGENILLAEKYEGYEWWYERRFDAPATRENVYLVFGKESVGLPDDLVRENFDRCLRIPMLPTLRCHNLSNSVAIAVYEVLRQRNFEDLSTERV